MATAESVKAKLQGLIDSANAKTGNSDADLTTAVDALVSGYGQGGGIIDVDKLPTGAGGIYVVGVSDAPAPLPELFGETATINVQIVETLPDVLTPTDLENLIAYLYIVESTGIVYADVGAGPMTLGLALFEAEGYDKGWSTDINSETEMGVYCVRGESIDETAVYKLTQGNAEVYLSANGSHLTIAELYAQIGTPFSTPIYVVDALPSTMETIDQTNYILPIYVLESTGVAYVSSDGITANADTLGSLLNAPDKGWSDDLSAETELGVYCVRESVIITYNTYHDGAWVDYIDGETARNKIDTLTTENKTLTTEKETLTTENAALETEVAEKTASANFTDYTSLSINDSNRITFRVTNRDISSITIHESIGFVGDHACYNCRNLERIIIPDYVSYIGESAFENCTSLKYIEMPDTLTSILDYAFKGCSSLKDILIPKTTGIGTYVFQNCTGLLAATICEGVTSTNEGLFDACSKLMNLRIPATVTRIGKNAFRGCTSLLNIYFQGTKAQWKAITFGTDWNSDTASYIIHCTDGEIGKDGTEY